ncbi:MAG: hypothetical protein ACRDTC_23040 [Pseudonocardiaceae bacterium]
MSVDNPDELMHTVLPPALEVLTAWSIAETDEDPAVFHQTIHRAIGDAARCGDPVRGLAQMMFGLSALAGILLDELGRASGRSHCEVLQAVHHRYLNPTG